MGLESDAKGNTLCWAVTLEGLFRERWFVYDRWDDSVMLGLLNKSPEDI